MSDDFTTIEEKWRRRWAERGEDFTPARPKRKFYCLEMFAYPSGDIHMGHFRNYSVGDVVARLRRMQGYDVLHPFGWDAFGLPAEEAAIKRGVHPREWTMENIEVSRATLRKCSISYDWEREVVTCRPDYYRWNQWLFLLLHKRGLAYRKTALVNWCPGCKTVLANEQAEDGTCWKCESPVQKRELEQWFIRITAYADRLLHGLDALVDWPEDVKAIQRNWIGRSEGAVVKFRAERLPHDFEVFTTRADTLHGATFLAIAPEHPWARMLVAGTDRESAVEEYIQKSLLRSEIDRTSTVRVKDGVDTGAFAVHPLTGERVPVWVADYVLAHYGTGIVMGVPAHDERDFAFAKRYRLPIKVVIRKDSWDQVPSGDELDEAWTGPGTMVNSGLFDGTRDDMGRVKVPTYLQNRGLGSARVTWRLRDWLISRQRYWGTPIPMIRCQDCGDVEVPEKDLPVLLPEGVKNWQPKGRSPLADVPEFLEVKCPKCGKAAERDADTMDTFIDSSWYHLRYADPKNGKRIFDPAKVRQWLPVDLYVGGREHATGHLLYFRFLTMVLHDAGLLDFEEPALRLYNHGMVQDVVGKKMSKSKGNLVSPIEMMKRYGVDASRVAMCFFAPSDESIVWKEQGVAGALRFLRRALGFVAGNAPLVKKVPEGSVASGSAMDDRVREGRRLCHTALRNMSRAVESGLAFNTVVSDLMKALNVLEPLRFESPPGTGKAMREGLAGHQIVEPTEATRAAYSDAVRVFVRVLAPMAPHLGEELHEVLGGEESVFRGPWPEVDPSALQVAEVEYAVQVNGKVRGRFTVPTGTKKDAVVEAARSVPEVRPHVEGRLIMKTVFVEGRLVNFVVR
jgi:leucyl-tRNA synthetase